MAEKNGVLVVDKPRGPTSHDVVAKARRALGTKAVGHAGTLDPMATGVLVVAVGEATKLVSYLSASDKEYEATVALGVATDTLDAEGRETSRAEVPASWRDALEGALDAERKRTMQLPPIFSAIHAKGARSHELARRGEAVELAERPVRVVALEVHALGEAEIQLRLTVSKGYYVRALARDLAAHLGTVGHLTALRRIRSGAFSITEAIGLDAFADARLVPVAEAAARALPTCTLSEAGVAHARAGRAVPLADLGTNAPGEHAWLAADGALVAVGRIEEGAGRVTRGFH
ncbi:MAG TPA: tRNA pseudouridine(55) synthase TruB [Polyangiaceae bacterium]